MKFRIFCALFAAGTFAGCDHPKPPVVNAVSADVSTASTNDLVRLLAIEPYVTSSYLGNKAGCDEEQRFGSQLTYRHLGAQLPDGSGFDVFVSRRSGTVTSVEIKRSFTNENRLEIVALPRENTVSVMRGGASERSVGTGNPVFSQALKLATLEAGVKCTG